MEFSIATLLSNFTDEKLVAPKVLEKKLGCRDQASLEKLQIALDLLEKMEILVKDRGRYRRVPGDVVEAKLRCSSKGFCFAIQDVEGADDIYIQKSHLSTAWNGDRVLVEITKEGSRRRSPEGKVRLILDRANPSVLARVKLSNSHYQAVPLDDRLLFELDLQENHSLDQAVDHLVHVEVLRYPLGENPPIGKVARILGSDAEDAADTDIVCCKHDLRRHFPEEVLKAAEDLPQKIAKTELKQRLDLRELLTITIESDSESDQTTVVENAFTLQKTEEGDWQLGVHITDVARLIAPDSELDDEARSRGTTVYLGDTVLPLLPDVVAEICSLVPDKDRLTISVLLTLNSAGQLLEFEIQPSVIKVDHQLSYEQAQSMLGDHQSVDSDLESVVEMLTDLFFTLSPAVRALRQQRGAFELHLWPNQYPYKDEGRIGALVVSSSLPMRSLLTELVILANQAVASHLYALTLPGIYCIQGSPDIEELQDLLKLGNNLELDLQLEDEEEVSSQDYQNFTQLFAKSSAAKVLNHLLLSTLKPAGYSSKPGDHFGLASDSDSGYTHCVSPLWRYADLFVQRLLVAVFEQGRDRRSTRSKERVNLRHSSCHGKINWNVLPPDMQQEFESHLASLIPHLNDREKLAQDAEVDLQGLKKAEQMKERTGEVFSGLITGVQSYGFFVEIEDLLVEGLVHVSSLKDDWYEYRSRHACLVGRKNRTAYKLGDRVQVQVKSVDYYRQQIDLVTVSGGSIALNEDLEE
ncbi:VacB/RNase II family 3'-5' exoribonuclease [Lyngbya aestuarii]|uniref:VacB/RNase II family 3'-5' exoribonuclease n=1 Tax=Lyngbya aestuarii TaxID=118322 RepID=UPI00403D96FF